jgi:TRAP-type C4-dicarboxylate transport system permease small subunit
MLEQQENILFRGLLKIVAALNSFGSLMILWLVVIINADVFSRFVFNAPIDGVKELVELSIVAIVFLQLPDAVRAGKLIRSDALFQRVIASNPRLGHWMGVLFDFAGAVFFVAILFGGIPLFIDAFDRGYYIGNQGMFMMPVWPVRLILVIGCVATVFVFLTFIVARLKLLLDGRGAA